MNKQKEPLYRKENRVSVSCRARVASNVGGEYRHFRNSKEGQNDEAMFRGMSSKKNGRDYKPLFKFLLSKVGKKWDDVYSEAKSRLDTEEPIWYMVKLETDEKSSPTFRYGEGASYSTLKVDEDGIIQFINKDAEHWPPSCTCCTHSFNGKPIPSPKSYGEIEKNLQSFRERNGIV